MTDLSALLRPAVLSATLIAAIGFACVSAAARPGPPPPPHHEPRQITVNGEGSVTAVPDMALISAGVTTQDDDARAALDANTAAMSKVIDALKEQGIERKDIQTTNFSVQPRYRRDRDNATDPEIVGYQVVNSVQIRVREREKLGAILDRIVSLGSNTIGGIAFAVSKPDDLMNQARGRAVADARAKADLLARAAGAELGPVMTITETGGGSPRPMFRRAAMAADVAPAPIEAGEQEIEAHVNVTWELR